MGGIIDFINKGFLPSGSTRIFSYIHRLGPFFGVPNFEFQYFFFFFFFWGGGGGGVQKNDYFLGYEDFVDIIWGRHNNYIGLVLGVILCILGSFLKVNVHNGVLFRVAKNSNIFLGCLI